MINKGTDDFSVQRRSKRIPIHGRIGFFYKGVFQFGETAMLSAGGLLFSNSKPIDKGETIEAHFYLPSGRFIKMKALVLYNLHSKNANNVESVQVGLSFLEISEEDQEAIKKLVNKK